MPGMLTEVMSHLKNKSFFPDISKNGHMMAYSVWHSFCHGHAEKKQLLLTGLMAEFFLLLMRRKAWQNIEPKFNTGVNRRLMVISYKITEQLTLILNFTKKKQTKLKLEYHRMQILYCTSILYCFKLRNRSYSWDPVNVLLPLQLQEKNL